MKKRSTKATAGSGSAEAKAEVPNEQAAIPQTPLKAAVEPRPASRIVPAVPAPVAPTPIPAISPEPAAPPQAEGQQAPASAPASTTSSTNAQPEPAAEPAVKTPASVPVAATPLKKGKKEKKPSAFLARMATFGLGKEREALLENLATLLNAGLPLVDSLKTLELEARQKPLKKLIHALTASVESGTPLWKAMLERHFFTPYAIALVRIGEESGALARNMLYLAEQQSKDHELRQKVKMAMIYPMIVLVLVLLVVIGLGGFVLPNLIPVLYALNAPLPFATLAVIAVSDFFTTQGKIVIPGVFIGLIGLFLLHTFTRFRAVTQWVMFHIPGIGSLAKQATIARFGVILGGLLKAGVPLVEGLKSLTEVTWIVSYKSFYQKLTDGIIVGQSFQKTFQSIRGSTRLLPISVQSLVVVGEKSGSLSEVLLKISDIYDRKAGETAQKLPIILEPVLLIFMGGLVGTIAYAIIIPIYSVVGNIQ